MTPKRRKELRKIAEDAEYVITLGGNPEFSNYCRIFRNKFTSATVIGILDELDAAEEMASELPRLLGEAKHAQARPSPH